MIEIYNPVPSESEEAVSFDDMEVGVLYQVVCHREYDTMYTKTLSGQLAWFEPENYGHNRLNVVSHETSDKYKKAPKGSYVVITND